MPRTVVLLETHNQVVHVTGGPAEGTASAVLTQLTNSNLALLEFPETGKMPDTIEFDGREFSYLDQPTHETDHPGAELYRYVEVVAAPTGSTPGSTTAASKSGPGWSAA